MLQPFQRLMSVDSVTRMTKHPCRTAQQNIYVLLYIYNNAFEYSFLTTAEKLIAKTVRGQLSYAVGNARALGLARVGSRNEFL